jgi:hypothetical protein
MVGVSCGTAIVKRQLPFVSAGPLPSRDGPMDSRT